jgi:nucleoside-diphosphate-sugar epimerase
LACGPGQRNIPEKGTGMLTGEKILVTGPAGQIAFPLSRELAKHNEVWGIARFSKGGGREQVEAAGVTTRRVDLGAADYGDLPDDFTYVLHLAAYIAPWLDYDAALRVNAEGTGLLLTHCRKAKAAMVMTTTGVYKPHADPWHAFLETDPLGDSNLPSTPTYSISKISEEAVARTCARQFNLPTVIVRMNAAYGDSGSGGLLGHHFDAVQAGTPVNVRWDPNPYSPIHERDIFDQLPALLGAASVPAAIVNWGGDQAVTAQQWCEYFGELIGKPPEIVCKEVPNTQRGVVVDNARRLAITGPCRVDWRQGMREMVEARRKTGR